MRIVVASPTLTYPGVAHAGGEYLLRHLRVLAEVHDVMLLVPERGWPCHSPETASRQAWEVRIVPARSRSALLAKALELRARFSPTEEFSSFWADVAADRAANEALAQADVIELHWFEMISTAPRLARQLPGVPIHGVFYDISSQKVQREVAASQGKLQRGVRSLRLATLRRSERRASRKLRVAACLSEKDAALLRTRTSHPSRIRVVDPPLDEPAMLATLPDLSARELIALLVSDFSRAVNAEATRWVLDEVWPLVRERCPGARLVLAGGGMTASTSERVVSEDGVSATGYLPSLAEVYQQARVALSPPRNGAGIKFKSIVPMLWGVPVVATEVGAEGIPRALFWAVSDSAQEQADAIVLALEGHPSAAVAASEALAGAQAQYGSQRHRDTVTGLYAG